ncbi:hypothetical protein FERRO_16330 [Ferrovum sp. JA12]|uniref:hypothetical protein n=1 Tax=Ferrovum sp. JA12 TaxID=1356299 RepID=UPI0007129219|nr:hypothetical protein [Ferrovum sp. JA12]KRH78641.1 hypothetical protein FERRO_16330 [Ferrovum sp. JA12]
MPIVKKPHLRNRVEKAEASEMTFAFSLLAVSVWYASRELCQGEVFISSSVVRSVW